MTKIAALLALTLLAAPAAAEDATPVPKLKAEAAVASDLVRIGDLVENAGHLASTPVFRAPDLGQTGAIRTERVRAALAPHGLGLIDADGLSEVVVRRASRKITAGEIERRIASAVAARSGIAAEKLVVASDRKLTAMHVDPSIAAEVNLTHIYYDVRSGRFDATIELPGGRLTRKAPLRITGSAVETETVAVLARAAAKGEIVREGAVELQRRPKAGLGEDAIRDVESAIGLSPRRPLAAGEVLRSADLMKPDLVQRNEPVLLLYEAPGIAVTVRGKALESGAEGDLVNVSNTQSKRTVQGVVVGPNRVSINVGPSRLAQDVTGAVSRNARRPE